MARATTFVVLMVVILQLAYPIYGIGVNWGTQTAQQIHPSIIVQLLKDNNINQIKLFDADHWTVKYFANTGIEVMLGIPNNRLEALADSYYTAKEWVKENVTKVVSEGAYIRYIAVGNEPFLTAYSGANLKTTFPAVRNIQRALDELGLGDKIKATIPQNADVYDSGSDGPSEGNFRSDIRDLMTQIVRFFDEHNTPFLVNIYPFLSLYQNPDFPIEFAFFEGDAKPVKDKGISYTNMLDANLDTLVWSLRKAGTPNLKIIIGEIGWPTDGVKAANLIYAKKFYGGYFKKMASKKGTPLYPGEIESYLFSLTDENEKSIAPGNFERHWGIFTYDGKPKFAIDFTGKGNEKMPVEAKNIEYLENKWCVLNGDIKNMDNIPKNIDYACQMSDCTKLSKGGSCENLDERSRASYAFNMFFQMNDQNVQSCNFEGLARIVTTNATVDQCLFPIALMESAAFKIGATPFFIGLLFLLSMLF